MGHYIEVHSSIIEKQVRHLLSNDNIIGVRECASIWLAPIVQLVVAAAHTNFKEIAFTKVTPYPGTSSLLCSRVRSLYVLCHDWCSMIKVTERYEDLLWYPILVKFPGCGYHRIIEMQGREVNAWNDMVMDQWRKDVENHPRGWRI